MFVANFAQTFSIFGRVARKRRDVSNTSVLLLVT